MPHKKSVFIFRRDLRLEDNRGLLEALKNSEEVLAVFIFDPAQIDTAKNPYFSQNAFTFMLDSLAELDEVLQKKGSELFLCEGAQEHVVETLIAKDSIEAVYVNKDYTPFSRKRDGRIEKVCKKHRALLYCIDDYTLSPIEVMVTGQGKPYTVFTPFLKKALGHAVPEVEKNHFKNYATKTRVKTVSLSKYEKLRNGNLKIRGGRSEALKLLKDTAFLKKYEADRNIPSLKGTSRLSPHHKFGTISIRETYWAAKNTSYNTQQFIAELYWRDFYLSIAYHFPAVFSYSFLPWANNIAWINNKKQFQAWCEGKTGVPIVDAGMHQLNETGWMHNRVRMIVASYLTKNLLIDWRWGEKYFASKLVDYDPASNNGGWQWSASTGADPRPLRIFNPYTQAQKYDPKAEYIKQWVPELKNADAKLLTDGKTMDFSEIPGYPAPLVDQKESYHRAMEAYKEAKKKA